MAAAGKRSIGARLARARNARSPAQRNWSGSWFDITPLCVSRISSAFCTSGGRAFLYNVNSEAAPLEPGRYFAAHHASVRLDWELVGEHGLRTAQLGPSRRTAPSRASRR